MDLKILQDTPPWDWPPSAGKTFLKVLTDRRASEADRLIAADLAGDSVVINDELAEALLALVSNAGEPEQLRMTAAISLGPVLEMVEIDGFDDPDPDMSPPIAEPTFRKIQDTLQNVYLDSRAPKELRRRVLEASVRFTEPWHIEAIRDAYAGGDREWMLTAVFGMRYIRGFDDLILKALKNPDEEIHFEAVMAAGNSAVDGAWPHVVELVQDPKTPKPLLIAAIEAVADIRPAEAREVLQELADSGDEEIAEAAEEAISMAESSLEAEVDEEEDEEEWLN